MQPAESLNLMDLTCGQTITFQQEMKTKWSQKAESFHCLKWQHVFQLWLKNVLSGFHRTVYDWRILTMELLGMEFSGIPRTWTASVYLYRTIPIKFYLPSPSLLFVDCQYYFFSSLWHHLPTKCSRWLPVPELGPAGGSLPLHSVTKCFLTQNYQAICIFSNIAEVLSSSVKQF